MFLCSRRMLNIKIGNQKLKVVRTRSFGVMKCELNSPVTNSTKGQVLVLIMALLAILINTNQYSNFQYPAA